MKDFTQRLLNKGAQNDSRLIFACDLTLSVSPQNYPVKPSTRDDFFQKVSTTIKLVQPHVAGVKINYPLFLSLGPDYIYKLLQEIEAPVIADFKVADISNTARLIADQGFGLGFDALIAHPFIGYEGGLDGLFEQAAKWNKGIILVINMSHPGSKQFITPSTPEFSQLATTYGADGVIAPATRLEEVSQARTMIGEDILLLTPGIGAQGGQPGQSVKAGADFEIVGRSIYTATEPGRAAEEIKTQINNTVNK